MATDLPTVEVQAAAEANALDPRIMRITIDVDGVAKSYEGLAVVAAGTKYANPTQNECEVKITNLSRETRDQILTETSPFKHAMKSTGVPKPAKKSKVGTVPAAGQRHARVTIEAGRVSTGYAVVFVGDVCAAVPSQPPDIDVTLRLATSDAQKCNIVARSQAGSCSLRRVCQQVATDLGLSLKFQARERDIANFSFTGGALRQVDMLGRVGNVNCYVDDRVLVVKDTNVALSGQTRVLNIDTGMIGIPAFTEQGIKVVMLYDNQTTLGSGLEIESKINPAANGLYVVFKLSFQLTNRDTPFYLIAEAKRA